MGSTVWQVSFDKNTSLEGAKAFNKIGEGQSVGVTYIKKGNILLATDVEVKGTVDVPHEWIIGVKEMTQLVAKGQKQGSFSLYDSRPGIFFLAEHIEGAISIYDAEFDKNLHKLPKDKDRLLIFYCAGDTCRLSPSSASRAEKLGYKNIKVFKGGLPAWKKAKNLVYSSAKYLKTFAKTPKSVVLLDLRSPLVSRKGHIKGAYSYPLSELQTAKAHFPKKKNAPIVLFSDRHQDAIQAFKTIRSWGYINTSVLEGGLAASKKSGIPVVAGNLASRISYVPKPVEGMISVKEFDQIAKNQPADTIILDVRDYKETKSGKIKGALNIPTQDVASSLSKIPKNKEIIVYCRTGIRAEMAYHTLKENGYKVRFLKAKIKISADGSYILSI